ncbi:hypothetical protein TNCV_1909281 [Trichonephila clavipes]|nr:hypothetical protein TNCV_1909281 [Trichonephila clavipes]
MPNVDGKRHFQGQPIECFLTDPRRPIAVESLSSACMNFLDILIPLKPASLAPPTFSFHVHQSGHTVSITASQRQSPNTPVVPCNVQTQLCKGAGNNGGYEKPIDELNTLDDQDAQMRASAESSDTTPGVAANYHGRHRTLASHSVQP